MTGAEALPIGRNEVKTQAELLAEANSVVEEVGLRAGTDSTRVTRWRNFPDGLEQRIFHNQPWRVELGTNVLNPTPASKNAEDWVVEPDNVWVALTVWPPNGLPPLSVVAEYRLSDTPVEDWLAYEWEDKNRLGQRLKRPVREDECVHAKIQGPRDFIIDRLSRDLALALTDPVVLRARFSPEN